MVVAFVLTMPRNLNLHLNWADSKRLGKGMAEIYLTELTSVAVKGWHPEFRRIAKIMGTIQ